MVKYLNYKRVIGAAFFLISSMLFLVAEKIIIIRPFSFDRLIIVETVLGFSALHFLIDIRKLWNFIFNKRYLIGVILFFLIVLRGYNGSSVGYYNDAIQPTIREREDETIWGNYKYIRSDEFVVNTPGLMSQKLYNKNLKPVNEDMRATKTEVTLFPMLPSKTISILATPHLWGFLFLSMERAFSVYWYLPLFWTFFAVFELFLLITQRKKILSLTGTCLLTFSPALLWWHSFLILASGVSAVLLLEQFLQAEKFKKKLLFAVLIGWSGSCYIMTLYPAWQVPLGYLFLGLFIWRISSCCHLLKWKDLLYIFPVQSVILIIIMPAVFQSQETIDLMRNTIYPGERDSSGGSGWWMNFNYYISILFGVRPIENSSESAQFISLYPLPIVVGVWQSISNHINKNKDRLLNILLVVSILMTLWNYFPLEMLSKLSMMSLSTPKRSQLIVNLICVILMIKLLSDYPLKMEKLKWIKKMVLSLFFVASGMLIVIQRNREYLTTNSVTLMFVLFFILTTLFLFRNIRGNNLLCYLLISMSLFSMMTIQPITKGLTVMTSKPAAKEVQKIRDKDPEAVWVATNSIVMPSYLLANGVRTLNSVNYTPNFKFWRKLDPEGKQEEIYNRYAHVTIKVSDTENSMQLLAADSVEVVMDAESLKKMGVDYIFSYDSNLEEYSDQDIRLKRLYLEDGISIYAVN